jgi:hypothetical protein
MLCGLELLAFASDTRDLLQVRLDPASVPDQDFFQDHPANSGSSIPPEGLHLGHHREDAPDVFLHLEAFSWGDLVGAKHQHDLFREVILKDRKGGDGVWALVGRADVGELVYKPLESVPRGELDRSGIALAVICFL